MGVTQEIRDIWLYLEVNAPGKRMGLPIPQAELPVMAAGEEAVLGRMCTETPELIRVALEHSMTYHHCTPPYLFPPASPSSQPPNLDHRGETLSQVSPQQCILCGSH